MDNELAAVYSALFPSGPNAPGRRETNASHLKSLQSFIEDQLKVDDAIQKSRKKKSRKKKEEVEVLADPVSDEELKAELEDAVRKYKNNRKKRESEPTVKQPKREADSRQNCNGASERLNGEKTSSNGNNGNGDASTDLMELMNYFFGPQKSENFRDGQVKSYSEYEKLGAIPKRMAKNESNRSRSLDPSGGIKSRGGNSNAVVPKPKRTSGADVTKLSQETSSLPFFYIVPENPSPEFFLPRGSYYVVPGVPDSPAEDRIVFHPEKSSQSTKKKDVWGIKPNSEQKSPKMNNLSKDIIQKTDSHLNIGPLDVKMSDFSNNLESNYNEFKVYDKKCMSSSEESVEIYDDAHIEPTSREENMHPIELFAELAVGLLDESAESENVNPSENQRTVAQLERLVSALPDSDFAILLEKSNEFKGDETLEAAYIEEVRFKSKVQQCVLELQHIFPDADPDFLQDSVEELNCDGNAISLLTNELLEGQDYPRISDDPRSMEKARLWNKYVRKFNVKEYIREVRDPQVFTRSRGNNGQDTGLVYKYLQAKYPNTSLDQLERYFQQYQNLTNTCALLNSSEVVGPWKKSIEKEDYTEEFLREVCYIEHREEIDKYVEEMRERREIEREDAFENNCFLSCPLCADEELVPSDVVTCPEGHVFCTECVTQFSRIQHQPRSLTCQSPGAPAQGNLMQMSSINNKKSASDEMVKNREIIRGKLKSHQGFREKPKMKTGARWTEERKKAHSERMKEYWRKVKEAQRRGEKKYVTVKMSEGVYKFRCPLEKCETFFTLSVLEGLLTETIMLKVIQKQQAEEISVAEVEGLESCPYCEFAYIPSPEDKIFKCGNPACLIETCRKCQEKNHIPLRCEEIERPVDLQARKKIEETMTEKLIRVCPKCRKKIIKIDGCNKIGCSCGALFCYICQQSIAGYNHFDRYTPGGCPLYSNNDELHNVAVVQAGIQARDEILRQNPEVRLVNDPTQQ